MFFANIEQAIAAEQQRRLALLGATTQCSPDNPDDLAAIRQRAHLVALPPKRFLQWHQAYRTHGVDGITPHEWDEVPDDVFVAARQQADLLGAPLDLIVPDDDALHTQATALGWTDARYRDWWRRYRSGGLIALAPGFNPHRRRRRSFHGMPPRDLGLLDEQDIEVMLQRRAWLGDLTEQPRVAMPTWEAHSAAIGVSVSTLRRYHARFRSYGLLGLAPQVRIDQGHYHALSERMVEIIRAIRLTQRNWKVRAVFDVACEKAQALGEMPPTVWQVRAICERLPPAIVALADGREQDFRNNYRFTHPIHVERERVIWQIDHKEPLDILVRDQRSERYRSATGATRPYVTHVEDFHSRLLMHAVFGYDKPDRFTVAEAIRGALLTSPTKPYGGIPDEIWVDNGQELIANHVHQLCRILGITLHNGRPRHPEERGRIERLHQTFDQGFYAIQPGYLPRDHSAYDSPIVPELTLDELVARFWIYVEKYHHRRPSEREQSPLEAWATGVFTLPVDERLLDMLLLEASLGKVVKRGIRYANHYYTHPELALYAGQTLLFRSPSHYAAPPYIEVYDEQAWLCQAKVEMGADGPAMTRDEVAQGQHRQRVQARSRIAAAQQTLTTLTPVAAPPEEAPKLPLPPSLRRSDSVTPTPVLRSPDLLDWLLIQKNATERDER